MLPMRVTMREVAARANVSLKTVSRVVNGEPHIRPEMQERVRAAIEDLGWTPNLAARTLRTGRTSIVGIVVADLRRPLLASLVETLVTEVDRHGLNAAVEPTHGDPARLTEVWAQRGARSTRCSSWTCPRRWAIETTTADRSSVLNSPRRRVAPSATVSAPTATRPPTSSSGTCR